MSDTRYSRFAKDLFVLAHRKRVSEVADNTRSAEALFEGEINEMRRTDWLKTAADYQMMQADQLLEEGDPASRQAVVDAINSNNFDERAESFFESYRTNKHAEYLSAYSLADFRQMKTYKVNGYDAGFAIKSGGDIVSVHNNTGVGGLGKTLIDAAIRLGGDHLDHFDGFLTKLYRDIGFTRVVNVDTWNDAYAPANWKAEPIDITDADRSVYANEWTKIERGTPAWKAKAEQYASGKPDVVYRYL